jgi:IS5 family transposase
MRFSVCPRLLPVYFVQQWYWLADEAVEDAFYDSQVLRGFAGIELNRDPVPDATTVLHFRHWLEKHELTKSLFDEVSAMLAERGLLMRQGTIVDATIIAAPASTKNKEKSARSRDASDQEGQPVAFRDALRQAQERISGWMSPPVWSTRSPAPQPTRPTSTKWRRYCTARRKRSSPMPATPGRPSAANTPSARCRGTLPSSAASSRPCRKRCGIAGSGRAGGAGTGAGAGLGRAPLVKNLFRHKKLRYRGLAKNTALHTLFALANLMIVKKTLLAPAQA